MTYENLCLLLDGEPTEPTREERLRKIKEIQEEILLEKYLGFEIEISEYLKERKELWVK